MSSVGFAEVQQVVESGLAASSPVAGVRLASQIDPLKDVRWDNFTQTHPRASVFHSRPWLEALARTYGYKPVALTTSGHSSALQNAVVFCRVESWLTGRRLVSLPFSDHCEPLVDTDQDRAAIGAAVDQECRREHWRYVELRPLKSFPIRTTLLQTEVPYSFHHLALDADLDTIFSRFHRSSIQRKIHRAEREGLRYCEGSSDALTDQFYRLFKLTRQRHKLPPQPRKWFVNLVKCFGDALKIRVAYKSDRPVAAMLTLRHKGTMVYKYGCSDSRFNNLGSMHLLYWRAIQEAKAAGLRLFDFGRTDAGQKGLITFKNRWGATQSELTYVRYGNTESSTHFFDLSTTNWKPRVAKYVLSHLPAGVVSKIGQALYGHVG